MHIETEELASLLFYSFHHCLGRKGYAITECTELLKKYWFALPDSWKDLIKEDIETALENNMAGDVCDVVRWRGVLALPSRRI